jgi:hypothetical protein
MGRDERCPAVFAETCHGEVLKRIEVPIDQTALPYFADDMLITVV